MCKHISAYVIALGVITPFATAQLVTQSGLSAQDLVDALVGTGPNAPTVSNITMNCHADARGTFSGGTGIIGFESGVILSSGCISNVIAPGGLNTSSSITCMNGTPGDADLNALIPQSTFDACVLEFDFECDAVQILSFQYVFASDEYNQWVNTQFNDVFAFFVNGVNIALLPDGVTPVSINNVNGGNPLGTNASNPAFFLNNMCGFGGLGPFPCVPFFQTEMDGLTVVLTASVAIAPGSNHIKLAIADAGDSALDSNVFLKGESFICGLIDDEEPGQGEGCSPGFWKQSHHLQHWSGYAPTDLFCDVFACSTPASMSAYGGKTLLEVLWQGGGQLKALGRQAVAALLNAASGVSYDLTQTQVKQMVNDAIASGSNAQIESIKNELDFLNNQGCPSPNTADMHYTNASVDVFDLLLLLSNWGTPVGDLNDDGNVDVFDMLILISNWGPQPAVWTRH